MVLRPLTTGDQQAVLEVYRQAVKRCPEELYSGLQRHAWVMQANPGAEGNGLRRTLERGIGTVSVLGEGMVVAFAVREPPDHVALLYCHPDHQRQGHGTVLLRQLMREAAAEGVKQLRTEASFLSCGLFEREGWQHSWREELLINSVRFRRFRMHRPLAAIQEPWPKHSSSSSSTRCDNSMPSSP
jgi:putative acetyltransferase